MVNLPELFSSLRREQLLYDGPTPVHPLHRLSKDLDQGVTIWIKREDTNSGLAFGGNKVRKMEYVLPEAIAAGADTLVTEGGLQSNHCRQVAAIAAKYGLKSFIVQQTHHAQPPSATYDSLGNIQLLRLLGATMQQTTPEEAMKTLQEKGQKPYFIPSGASAHPFGGLGFARWAFELAEQEAQLDVHFGTIVVACASGSTLGGMLAGFALLAETQKQNQGRRRRLIGIATTPDIITLRQAVLKSAYMTAEKIGVEDTAGFEDVEVDRRFVGGGYGVANEETVEAVEYLAELEGVLTDPVYTGKTLGGLLGMVRGGEIHCEESDSGEAVLFVHTGGVPVLSAYSGL